MPTPPYAVTTAPLDLDALVRTVGALGEMSDNGAFMPTPPYAVTTAPLDLDALVRTVGALAK